MRYFSFAVRLGLGSCLVVLAAFPAHASGVRINNPFALFSPSAPRNYAAQPAAPAVQSSKPVMSTGKVASVNDYAVPVPQPRPAGLYVAAAPAQAVTAVSPVVPAVQDKTAAAEPITADVPAPKKSMTAQDRAEEKIMSSIVLGGKNSSDEPAKSEAAAAPKAASGNNASMMFSAKPSSDAVMGSMSNLNFTAPAAHSGLGVLIAPSAQNVATKD